MNIKTYFLITLTVFLTFSSCYAKRVTLPRNIVNGKCILNQSMFKDGVDEYVAKYKFDLDNKVVYLPKGSKLIIKDKGSIANGEIVGNNSDLVSSKNTTIFFNVKISGEWHVDRIYSKWFNFGEIPSVNSSNFKSLISLTDDNHKGIIYVSEGTYPVEITEERSSCISLNSYTDIFIDGEIILRPNDLNYCNIIYVGSKKNVNISGKGAIVGDVENHIGKSGEWGMGINISSSENVSVKDLTIRNCWGDCVYIGQYKVTKDNYSKNVLIEDVICQAGRRQGLSIVAGKDITIYKCKFIDTGKIKYTAPGRGVDIEPNDRINAIVQNILIEGCEFSGNYNNNDLLTCNMNENASITIRNCFLEGWLTTDGYTYNLVVDSCRIHAMNYSAVNTKNIKIKNTFFDIMPPQPHKSKISYENCVFPKEQDKTSMLFWPIPIGMLLAGAFLTRKRK